jgi:RNA polymerase sigma-70 factor (ECF subfamily)
VVGGGGAQGAEPEVRAVVEHEIAGKLRAGDVDGALDLIVRSYGPELLSYLAALTRDDDRAVDAFADASEEIWRGLPRFRGECAVRTWVYRIAWHTFLRHRRDGFVRRAATLGTSRLNQLVAEARTTTARWQRSEVKDAIARLREKLDAGEQTILVLRVDRGLSWAEVAAVLESEDEAPTEATLAKRFERIKAKLRRLAQEEGLIPGE